ncbi:SDR family NAD(P)-dependent oxidoreductase [Mesorhizobium sp. CU3]|uniref:NAD(P)/FAD-dependent oxidoreductase n=1 Tax=Mesorhizobium sp. CU3 TaxID=2589984 RepID=UPI00112647AF|nr:SDR family NAD(P)-dependent oxidoreductase [Mesorhizobium sp. CU3]
MKETAMFHASASPDAPTTLDESVDVVIVGAGLSGIGAACHLARQRPHGSFTLLEARGDLGGTWDLFRYPGIRSDSDMFTLGYSFRPWPNSRAIADGPAILRYLRDTAVEHGIDRRIRYGHRVVDAAWDSSIARWIVTAETVREGATVLVRIRCRWLSVCTGYYRYDQGHRPHFEGEDSFGGEIISPQHWPQKLDWTGKRVTVIGSGATAVTLVPALAKAASHVTMLQRTPSYIVSVPGEDTMVGRLERLSLPPRLVARIMFWKNVVSNIFSYEMARHLPRLCRRLIRKETQRELGAHLDVDTHFNPPYNPWDQRVCAVPDGDLFVAIRDGRAAVVTDTIERLVANGIQTSGGQFIPSDIVVAATGLQMMPLGGMTLCVDGRPVSLPDSLVYKGMMLSDVPNFNLVIGYTNNSWTLKADLVSSTVARLICHLERRGFDFVRPHPTKAGATLPFVDLRSGYVQRAITAFPKQGDRTPWRLHQNYIFDLRLFRRDFSRDPALQFRRLQAAGPAGQLASPATAAKELSMSGFDFSGTAIVTGAAGGIGRALARQLADRGCDVVVVDRDEQGLNAVLGELRSGHPNSVFTSYAVDLTDGAAVQALGETLAQKHPATRLLVNNAGVALSGSFAQCSKEDFDWLLAVNLQAPIDLVRALLPVLRRNRGAHIANISSVFGLVAPAGNVAYATSKFGLRGLTEALRAELGPDGIGVTCVHPGGIKTNIALASRIGSAMTAEEHVAAEKANAEFDKVLTISAEAAARAIVDGIARRRARVLIGASAKIPDLVARLFPSHYHGVVSGLEAAIGWLSSIGRRRSPAASTTAKRVVQ